MWKPIVTICLSGVIMLINSEVKAESKGFPANMIPDSIGIQTKPNTSNTEDLQEIGKLGAKIIRRGFYWDKIEVEKGKYDFTEYDKLLKDADDNGLRVLGCLFGNNKIHENDNLGGIQTEEGRQGFAKFAAACAEHFKGRGVMFEIWNEPNVRSFWRKTGKHNSEPFAEEYTALVKAIVPEMRKADPDVIVFAGSVSCFWQPSFEWTNFCFSKGMYESGISGWSVHPYGLQTPEQFTEGYNTMRTIMEKYKVPKDFPMVNTERGFATDKYTPRGGTAGTEGWSGGPKEWAEQYQAWFVVRQFLIDRMNGINFTIWYEWNAKKFGLIVDGKKQPAYDSCKNMIQQLQGYAFKERLKTEDEMDYVLLFTNKAGGEKLVAWASFPPKSTPDKTKNHSIDVPVTATGQVARVDLFGKESSITIADGKIKLDLTGAPQYITLKK